MRSVRQFTANYKRRCLVLRRLFRPQLVGGECLSFCEGITVALLGEFLPTAKSVVLEVRVLWPLLGKAADRDLQVRLLTRMCQVLPSDGIVEVQKYAPWRSSRLRVKIPAELSLKNGYLLLEIGNSSSPEPIGRIEFPGQREQAATAAC